MVPKLSLWLLSTVLVLCQEKRLAESAQQAPGKFRSEMSLLAHFQRVPLHALQSPPLESKFVSDTFDCTFLCSEFDKCVSFNIQAEPSQGHLLQCELLDSDMFRLPQMLRGNETFHHYALQTPCMTGPCQNGGTCLADYQTGGYDCKCVQPFTGNSCEIDPPNCIEHRKAGKNISGVYPVDPDGLGKFDVFCDQTTAGGGWTVFQKRLDGSVDFYRGWADYKNGFGDLSGEFWLGLDKIHRLTSQASKELRVDLEDVDGNTAYAEYDSFSVADEASKYKLSVSRYSGTAGDSLNYHNGMSFTTMDADNDRNGGNCASTYTSAWWYNNCHKSSLNGQYLNGAHASLANGVNWYHWKGHYYSAKRAEMKVRQNPCKHGGTFIPKSVGYECACLKSYSGDHCEFAPPNCTELLKAGQTVSGVYPVDPDGLGKFDVFCDQTTAGGGWTVFQKRLNGSVDFYRGWADYKNGFGDLNGEFWLGLDKIHRLTSQSNKELHVDLEDVDGNTAYAEYDSFSVADEASKYKLSVSGYSGTAGDSLSYHHGMLFSTKDQDNDQSSSHCATTYKGAWWYKHCHASNLNGLYLLGSHASYANGINWVNWKGHYYSAKRAEMKIK